MLLVYCSCSCALFSQILQWVMTLLRSNSSSNSLSQSCPAYQSLCQQKRRPINYEQKYCYIRNQFHFTSDMQLLSILYDAMRSLEHCFDVYHLFKA
jgi:hypothetical protein